jgi:hypothetical protein
MRASAARRDLALQTRAYSSLLSDAFKRPIADPRDLPSDLLASHDRTSARASPAPRARTGRGSPGGRHPGTAAEVIPALQRLDGVRAHPSRSSLLDPKDGISRGNPGQVIQRRFR